MGNKFNELSNSPSSALLLSNRYSHLHLIQSLIRLKKYNNKKSAIVGSGAIGYFFTKEAPKKNVDPTAPHIRVGTESVQPMMSAGTFDIVIPQLPSDVPTAGHVIPGFQGDLVGVGSMCDSNCTVTFSKHVVNIYSPTGTPIIKCWCETGGPCLWRMSLLTNP